MTLRGMILGANALKPTGRLWVLVRRQNEHETTTLPDRTPWRWVRPSSFAMKWAVTRRGTVSFIFLSNPVILFNRGDAIKGLI
jgi:hypothetical protein